MARRQPESIFAENERLGQGEERARELNSIKELAYVAHEIVFCFL